MNTGILMCTYMLPNSLIPLIYIYGSTLTVNMTYIYVILIEPMRHGRTLAVLLTFPWIL